MKTTIRTDLIALAALLIVAAAWVVLAVTHNAVPDWLEALAATLAPLFVGLSVPSRVNLGGATDAEPAPATSSTPAPTYAAAAPVPAAKPAPGWDMTESFPAITAEQVTADKAAQA